MNGQRPEVRAALLLNVLFLTNRFYLAMVDLDGKPIEIPPWTNTSEGAATVITGMVDPTIAGNYNTSQSPYFQYILLIMSASRVQWLIPQPERSCRP